MRQTIKMLKNIAVFLGLLNVISLTSCKDTVDEMTVPVTGVALNSSNLRIQEGVEYRLNPIITPENATNKNVIWSVNELSVNGCVEIDAHSGLIKSLTPGTALITVTTLDGNFTASCGIEVVKEFIPIESIMIDETYTIVKDDKYTFVPVIMPEAPSNRELIWSLDNVVPEGCLEINTQTGEITAKEKGKATVNVVAADGRGAKASCEVTILSEYVPPTGISLKASAIEIEVGKSEVLGVEVLPENATNKIINWEVIDAEPAGCVIVENGLVNGIKEGKATVRATIKDTDLYDECIVTVLGPEPEGGFEIVDGVWFIYNLSGLLEFKSLVASDPSVNAKLMKDIDLGEEMWIPIGSEASPYKGNFDGNGKKISNLKIEEKDGSFKGFFARLSSATISNLGIESGIVDAAKMLGAIAGQSIGSKIINCYNNAKIASHVDQANAGGIVGNCIDSEVVACYNSGEIAKSKFGTPTKNNSDLGGIVGVTSGNSYIVCCYSNGKISNPKGPRKGGVVGKMDADTKMYGAYNAGVITSTNGWAIAGGGSITNVKEAFVGVYWTDIEGSKAPAGIKFNEDVEKVTNQELNSQSVIDVMNNSIIASGIESANGFEFVIGNDNYLFPVIKKK